MSENINLQSNEDREIQTRNILLKNLNRGLIYVFIFIIFTVNIFAVSLALQCNADKNILFRISSAIFAFMFGFLYIFMNYLMFRVNLKQNPCDICSNIPFPLWGRGYITQTGLRTMGQMRR